MSQVLVIYGALGHWSPLWEALFHRTSSPVHQLTPQKLLSPPGLRKPNASVNYGRPSESNIGDTNIYSLTLCSLTVNEHDWHLLVGNDDRIKSHCLTRKLKKELNRISEKSDANVILCINLIVHIY